MSRFFVTPLRCNRYKKDIYCVQDPSNPTHCPSQRHKSPDLRQHSASTSLAVLADVPPLQSIPRPTSAHSAEMAPHSQTQPHSSDHRKRSYDITMHDLWGALAHGGAMAYASTMAATDSTPVGLVPGPSRPAPSYQPRKRSKSSDMQHRHASSHEDSSRHPSGHGTALQLDTRGHDPRAKAEHHAPSSRTARGQLTLPSPSHGTPSGLRAGSATSALAVRSRPSRSGSSVPSKIRAAFRAPDMTHPNPDPIDNDKLDFFPSSDREGRIENPREVSSRAAPEPSKSAMKKKPRGWSFRKAPAKHVHWP